MDAQQRDNQEIDEQAEARREAFAEPATIKRRRVDPSLEEEKEPPSVVIKSHLKRKTGGASGTETASDWDEKESQTNLQANQRGRTATRSLRQSAKWDTPRITAAQMGETPRRGKWDMTPSGDGNTFASATAATPRRISATPSRFTNAEGATPTADRWSQ